MIAIACIVGVLLVLYFLLSRKSSAKDVTTDSKVLVQSLSADGLSLRSRLKLTSNKLSVSISVPKDFHVISSVVVKLNEVANVHLLVESTDNQISNELINILPNGFKLHRVLFYGSSVGKIAILRQLRPELHIEFDAKIANSVFPHLNSLLLFGNEPGIDSKIPNTRIMKSIDDVLKVQL